jgi:proteasome accessory factor B
MKRVLERLLNLLVYLRTSSGSITADDIRFTVPGYDTNNDVAFHRMFERDKELLRGMGISLSTEQVENGGRIGYFLRPDEYELADPGLTDEEQIALWLATRMVQLDGGGVDEALLKLGGTPGDRAEADPTATVGGDSEILALLLEAAGARQRVSFEYRGRDVTADPLGVLNQRGHWYLVVAGRTESRAYRVDRGSEWRTIGARGVFTREPKTRIADALPSAPWELGDDKVDVELLFDPSVAWRAMNDLEGELTPSPDGLRATISVANPGALIGWLLEYGAQAEIVSPAEIRQQLVDHLGSSK